MKNHRTVGIMQIMISASIYGIVPYITAITYQHGNNGLNMAFFRNLFCIPVLLFLVLKTGASLKLTKSQALHVAIASIVGPALTNMLLYSSYNYLNTGVATILHFIYPVFVIFLLTAFFKEKLELRKVISIVLSLVGIMCFIEPGNSANFIGLVLSVGSGLTYGFSIVWISKKKLVYMNPFVLSFYYAVISSITILLINPATHFLTLSLAVPTWILIFAIAMMTSIVALILMQKGLRSIDASTASILCLLEPLLGFLIGSFFQSDSISYLKIVGFILLITSIIFVTVVPGKKSSASS